MKLLRQFISKSLPSIPDFEKPDVQNVELGYVEPGHGMKGKKVWLLMDGDVICMKSIKVSLAFNCGATLMQPKRNQQAQQNLHPRMKVKLMIFINSCKRSMKAEDPQFPRRAT